VLSAGLAGIEQGLTPPLPSSGVPAEEDPSLEPLPASLPEALGELAGEPATKEFFGEEFLKVYAAMRGHELARFTDSVSDWERQEYLELF
jgi:glutamine synthetase